MDSPRLRAVQGTRALLPLLLAIVLGANAAIPCAPLPAPASAAGGAHGLHADPAWEWCGPTPAVRLEAPCPCGCESDGTPASGLVLARPDPSTLPALAAGRPPEPTPRRRATERPPALPDPIPIPTSLA